MPQGPKTYKATMVEPFLSMMLGMPLDRSIPDFCDARLFTPPGFNTNGVILFRSPYHFLHCEWNRGTGMAVVTAKQRGYAAVLTCSAWDASMQSTENFITQQDVPSDLVTPSFAGNYFVYDYAANGYQYFVALLMDMPMMG